jgi:hypothetical protein
MAIVAVVGEIQLQHDIPGLHQDIAIPRHLRPGPADTAHIHNR